MPGSGYKKRLQNIDYYTPLSPEQMECYRLKIHNATYNIEKSSMFSLGVTILCCLTNEHFTYFYDFSRSDVLFTKIVECLDKIRYSALLKGVLSNMLNVKPNNRPSFNEMKMFLKNNSTE